MEKLFLGVDREIITPQVGGHLFGYHPYVISDAVEDDLTVTAFYFRQGKKQALMVSVTVCLLQTALTEDILEKIEAKYAIAKQCCIISATHTHSGPNTAGMEGWGAIDTQYINTILLPQIFKAVEKAKENAQPVTMGSASGCSFVGINRREITEDNNVKLGQNPWGSFNPRMTVISFKNEQGNVVANLVHYGCHGTAAGENTQITRDWPGVMIDEMERFTGAVTAFFNGPEGDIGPRLSNGGTTGGNDVRYAYESGHVAAQDAVRIYREIYDYRQVSLTCSGKTFIMPFKGRMPQEEAKALYEKYQGEKVNLAGAIRNFAEKVIKSYKNGEPESEGVSIRQTVLVLGNMVIASFPYELFSEIGLRIDKAFADKRVLCLSCTNGNEGYFVTEDTLCRGGYEVEMFMYGHAQPYCDNADFELIKTTVNHIKTVLG